MVHELRKLCTELPLFVVIRLCTSEEDVVDFYNGLDEEVEFPLDVLDDLESEALEINKVRHTHPCGWAPVVSSLEHAAEAERRPYLMHHTMLRESS